MTTATDTALEPGESSAAVDTPAEGSASSSARPVELGGKLAGLSLPRQVYVLAIWPFCQQLLNWAVTAVDTAVAARLSTEAANAIAVAGFIGWLLGLLTMAIGAGATALIARAVGGRHRGLANAGLAQALVIALVWGTAVGAAIFALSPWIGWIAGLRDESLHLSTTYLRIMAATAPLAGLLFVGGMSLNGAGDTRSFFRIMLAVNLINVGVTLALVSRGYGVAGIATGTAAGWVAGAMLTLFVVIKPGGPIRLHAHRLAPHWHTIKRILRIALPSLVDRFGHWLGNFAVMMLVGYIAIRNLGGDGSALQGAHIVAIRIEAISFLPGLGVAVAASTLAGQYLGAGSPAMARRAVLTCWAVGAGIMVVMGLTFVLFPVAWTRLMTDEPKILALSPQLVRICGFVQIGFASYLVLSEAMRGAGDTKYPMILSNFSTWCIRLPAVWLMGIHFELGLVGVWYALCGELILRGMLFAGRFLHGGWMKVRV
ncbi:MAG: MATE family efflux transporter [Planctomycetota bacterium]